MSFAIIPQDLSISAMRNSGYQDSAYALAELIDNSIQAGEPLEKPTEVELICVDRVPPGGDRRRISEIAVFDTASGMDRETLRRALQFGNGTHLTESTQRGIGKFGMGLPNSSISQCKRVDVWSWQKGETYHTYLDVTEIEKGILTEVPVPKLEALPTQWLQLISNEVRAHGTLVVWSQLDRLIWKQSTALLRNTEFIAGRVYRYFLSDGRVRIRLAAYDATNNEFSSVSERYVRPNDPLYLMKGTNTPPPFDKSPAFEIFGEPEVLAVGYRGREHTVTIKASICSPEARKAGGLRPIGQHARKNQGVSVVRADREIELNRSFENSYDPRERWWGVEVAFGPGLDDIFGVTNNKQGATGFQKLDEAEDAAAEGLSVEEYRRLLHADQDPRLPMYLISNSVNRLLSTMRKRIERMKEGERVEKAKRATSSEAETIATQAVRRRQERIGNIGESDRQEATSPDVRAKALTSELEQDGIESAKAQEIAVEYVSRKIKFRFRHADVSGSALFDIASAGGVIIITLSTKHPAHAALFEALRAEADPDQPIRQKFLFLITAWARLEDEATGKMRTTLDEIRHDWGRVARDFFEDAES